MKSITLKKHFIVLAVLLATSLTAWADNTQVASGNLFNSSNEKICHWQLMSDGELILTAGTLNGTNYGSGDFTNVQLASTRFSDTNDNQAIKKLTISYGIKNLVNFPCNADKANKFENLEEVNAPFADLETIGSRAFWGSTKLKKVTLNTGLKVIGLSAFASCTALETVTITDVNNASAQSALTTIGVEAFSGCTKLQGFSLNCSGAVSIGSMAFKDCTSLKKFYTGGGAVTVDASAFSGSGLETFCNSSSALYVTNLTLQNGAFGGASKLKAFSISSSSDITIPRHAFQNCTSLEYFITWGGKVTVGNGAFEGCTSLKSISSITGVGITSVGSQAFSGCTSLESFTASADLTSIGTYAFENCTGMKYVDLRKAKYNTLKLNGGSSAYINRDDSWCCTMSKGAFIYAPSDYSGGYSGKNIVIAGTGDYAGKLVCSQCYFYDGMAVGFPSEGKFTAINGVHYERSVEHGKYYTVCLPYKIDFATCYTLKGVTGNTIEFEEVAYANREANKPYVFYNDADTRTSFFTSGNVEVGASGSPSSVSANGYTLWGNFERTIDADYVKGRNDKDYYVLQSDGTWKLFDGSNADVKIPPFRAYILVKKNAGAPAMLASDFGGGSTGIGDLTPSLSEGEGVWYDLQGRRIEGRPMQKGVYIVGGKKIIVK